MSPISLVTLCVAFVSINSIIAQSKQCSPDPGPKMCFTSSTAALYGVDEEVLVKYCKDYAKVAVVDSAHDKSTGRQYAAFEGDTFMPSMRQSKGSIFPLSLLEMRTGWAKYKGKMGAKLEAQSLFTFEEGMFFKKGYGYAGLNQAWMGCPISLCGVGGIDYMRFNHGWGGLSIHVGYHGWEMNNAYDVSPLISSSGPRSGSRHVGLASVSIPNRLQTFIFGDTVYQLLKHNEVDAYEYELTSGTYKGRPDEMYTPFPKTFPEDPDAIVNQLIGGFNYIYVFKGKEYWKYVLVDDPKQKDWSRVSDKGFQSYPKSISQINSDLEGIDEAFLDPINQELYLFKKFLFFKIKMRLDLDLELKDTNIKWRYFQRSLISCDDDYYKRTYGMKFKDFAKKHMPSKEHKDLPDSWSWWPILIIVFFMALGAALVGLLYYLLVYRHKKAPEGYAKYTKSGPKADGEDADGEEEGADKGPSTPLIPATKKTESTKKRKPIGAESADV